MNGDKLTDSSGESAAFWSDLTQDMKENLTDLYSLRSARAFDFRAPVRLYCSGLIGDGNWLLHEDPIGLSNFSNGVDALVIYYGKCLPHIQSVISHELELVTEIRELSKNKDAKAKIKIAARLRKLNRPDVAVALATQVLDISKLNYYARAVRGAAFSDSEMYDEAIEDGQIALKHALDDRKHIPLTLLAMALKNRFTRDGDLDDLLKAFKLALESIQSKREIQNVRVLLSILNLLKNSQYDGLTEELREFISEYEAIPKNAVHFSVNSSSSISSTEEIIERALDLDLPELDEIEEFEEGDSLSEIFGDYFEDYRDSLDDPQSPHLEP